MVYSYGLFIYNGSHLFNPKKDQLWRGPIGPLVPQWWDSARSCSTKETLVETNTDVENPPSGYNFRFPHLCYPLVN